MKRREVIAGIGAVGAIALLAGGKSGLANLNAKLTGHLIKPRALDITNQTDTTQTVRITIAREGNSTVVTQELTVDPETGVKGIWQTTRIGRYRIKAGTDAGRRASGDMFVCVGYYDAELLIEPEAFVLAQTHGDPEAGACSLDTNR